MDSYDMSQPPAPTLNIAISPGAITLPLADMLARQREAAPEMQLQITETSLNDQCKGLTDGRYDLGICLTPVEMHDAINTIPLWRDELMAVLPPTSPLLAFNKIPLQNLVQHPLVLWQWKDDGIVNRQIDALLASAPYTVAERVLSFGLMSVLVDAGYGVGICTQSWGSVSHKMGTVLRPIAGQPHYITTYITHTSPLSDSTKKFIDIAQQQWPQETQ